MKPHFCITFHGPTLWRTGTRKTIWTASIIIAIISKSSSSFHTYLLLHFSIFWMFSDPSLYTNLFKLRSDGFHLGTINDKQRAGNNLDLKKHYLLWDIRFLPNCTRFHGQWEDTRDSEWSGKEAACTVPGLNFSLRCKLPPMPEYLATSNRQFQGIAPHFAVPVR